MCRTSNPGAAELQELTLADNGQPLFQRIAQVARAWDPGGQIGLVVGATAPGALPAVRAANPEAWILAPGVGAQGGDLEATLSAGLRADGGGVLISVSRGIGRAADPAAAAAALVQRMAGARAADVGDERGALAAALIDSGCVRFGSFKLKSGLMSPSISIFDGWSASRGSSDVWRAPTRPC